MTATTLTASVLRLPGGRELSYCEFGDRAGIPVFGFHGTPGSRLQVAPTAVTPLPPGIRLIVPDRPGYGHSTFYPERRLTDWPNDVAAIADYLGIDRFAAFGLSGGGPHVLACAHALAPRLIGVGCVSGVGPLWDPAAAQGMLPLNRWLTRARETRPPAVESADEIPGFDHEAKPGTRLRHAGAATARARSRDPGQSRVPRDADRRNPQQLRDGRARGRAGLRAVRGAMGVLAR